MLGIALVVTLYFHPRGQEALYYIQWQCANDSPRRATYFARLRQTKPPHARMKKYWEARAEEFIPKHFGKGQLLGHYTYNSQTNQNEWQWGALAPALRHGYAESILPALIAAIKHENTVIRVTAIQALRHLGGKATPAIPLLIDLLKDENRNVSAAAAKTLGVIGKNEATAASSLLNVLTGNYWSETRLVAIQSLGQLGEDATAALPALRTIAEYDAIGNYRSTAKKAIRKIAESVRQRDQKNEERRQQRKRATPPKPVSAPIDDADDPW